MCHGAPSGIMSIDSRVRTISFDDVVINRSGEIAESERSDQAHQLLTASKNESGREQEQRQGQWRDQGVSPVLDMNEGASFQDKLEGKYRTQQLPRKLICYCCCSHVAHTSVQP